MWPNGGQGWAERWTDRALYSDDGPVKMGGRLVATHGPARGQKMPRSWPAGDGQWPAGGQMMVALPRRSKVGRTLNALAVSDPRTICHVVRRQRLAFPQRDPLVQSAAGRRLWPGSSMAVDIPLTQASGMAARFDRGLGCRRITLVGVSARPYAFASGTGSQRGCSRVGSPAD
jgi:hypothetical protein